MSEKDGIPRTEAIEELIRLARRSHYYCDDCWYSCPKSEDGCCDQDAGEVCNCGADKHNAKVDALAELLRKDHPMIDQLRSLMRRYIAGEIGYGEFRNAFVRFMGASDQDVIVEQMYNHVEGLCSAFDRGHVNEAGLKGISREVCAMISSQSWPGRSCEPRSGINGRADRGDCE